MSESPIVPATTAQETRPRRIRKAVKLGMVAGDQPLLQKFRLLNRLGYDGVELDSPNNLDPDEVIAARDETGLIIHGVVDSVHWRSPLSDPDASVRAQGRAALETALGDCHRYGGTTVLLVPAVVNKRVSYVDAFARSHREIQTVLPLAESLGGVESLIEHRASIEGPSTPVPSDLLRLSIGLENPDDLIADLDRALAAI